MLFSALEAVIGMAIGVAIPLVPLTLVWAIQFGFAPSYEIFWRGSVDVWLIGHGVDTTFRLDPATAASLGVAGADRPVLITIALLGFALLTALLGVRAGARIAQTGHVILGSAVLVVAGAAAAFAATVSALHVDARPSLWQGTLLPTLALALGAAVGILQTRRPRPARLDPVLRAAVGGALRAGVAAVALTLGVSAVVVALLIVGHYGELIRLYEALHTGVVGGLALTLGQLALLPDVVVWAASWFVGPGFALGGTGSHVSPLGTAVGPVPAIPLLGAIPTGELAYGFVGILVPVVAGFLAGAASRAALNRTFDEHTGARWPAIVATGLGAGAAGGLLLGLLAWAASGSAGPGRLVQVGPDPVAVGLAAAIEIGLAALVGVAASVPWPLRRADSHR